MTKQSDKSSRARLSRRGFMQTGAAAGISGQLAMLPGRSLAATANLHLEGYASATSVAPGGTLDFFIRDPAAVGAASRSCSLYFTRMAYASASATDLAMGSGSFSVGAQVVPANASSHGCGWTSSYRLTVPSTWPSGCYFAFVNLDGGDSSTACIVPFIVRPSASSAGVKTLVMIPVTTVHAYNAYGGKSIYAYNSSGGVRGSQVSLDRPITESFTSAFDVWSQHLVRWMAKNAIAADFCTDIDIESNPSILQPYQLVVIPGHDEYWSSARRTTMDNFVANGGNVAYLGGNTAWFQARLEAGSTGPHRTLVCYKDAAADPVTDPTLKTVNFISLATPRPENTTCGLGYLTGCSWVSSLPRPNTPSVVMRSEHWAFTGTGLAQGAGFGGAYVGYESNSALFTLAKDGRAYATGADGTPATTRILASADGSNWNALSLAAGGPGEQSGYAQVAVFSRGGSAGTVFNSGSNDWCYGLIPELDGQTATAISRITLNMLNKLAKPWTESADVRQFSKALTGSLFNACYGIGTSAPANSGLALDGWVCRAPAASTAQSGPLYRFRSLTPGSTGTRYWFNRGSIPFAGFTYDGIAFHAYAAARADTEAVYQHYAINAAGEWLFYLSNSATAASGWTAGAVLFHAPTDAASATVPAPAPPASPSFSLAAPPDNSLAVKPWGLPVVSDMIRVMPVGGFNESVWFTVTGAPPGVLALPSPDHSKGGTKLLVTALPGVKAGSYTRTVTGSSFATSTVPAATARTTMTVQVG